IESLPVFAENQLAELVYQPRGEQGRPLLSAAVQPAQQCVCESRLRRELTHDLLGHDRVRRQWGFGHCVTATVTTGDDRQSQQQCCVGEGFSKHWLVSPRKRLI